ncbi:MAG: NUDIX domain-containing protein [Bacteroidota bacterium]
MYKVFVNELPLILTDQRPENSQGNVFDLDEASIKKAIRLLSSGDLREAFLYHPDGQHIMEIFKHKLPVVVAAGGFVTNKKNKVLFIYRNGKWDLPKGKLDKGESIEQAAIREVEEETGVTGLKITGFMRTTYHIFKRNGEFILKQVHWFAMTTDFEGKLQGQAEEGILKAKWKGPKKTKEALENSYFNIKLLFDSPTIPK